MKREARVPLWSWLCPLWEGSPEDKYWQVGDRGLSQNTESHIIRKYIIEEDENLYPKLKRKTVNQDM